MYVALWLLGLGGGAWALRVALEKRRPRLYVAAVGLLVGTPLFFLLLSVWGELLWFEALGYEQRFWRQLFAQLAIGAGGGCLGFLVVWLLTLPLSRRCPRQLRLLPAASAGLVSGVAGALGWSVVLRAWYLVPSGVREPIHGLDTSFYLFRLPLYDGLYRLSLVLCGIALAAGLAGTGWEVWRGHQNVEEALKAYRRGFQPSGLWLPLVAFGCVLGWGRYLDSFHLLYSDLGVVTGPGWTDVHIRLPAYLLGAWTLPLGAFLLLVPRLRHFMARLGLRRPRSLEERDLAGIVKGWAALLLGWMVVLGLLPAGVQWLIVEPNEITFERPYIRHNIEATRRAFNLHRAEERLFAASGELSGDTLEHNRHLLSEVRLWDWGALDAVYKQFQEIRLYYEFTGVDVDRYQIADRYRQVMVSARELLPQNLPEQSQTFVNRRFKYTHGFGLTMAPVSDFTADGLPNLLIKDIPPQASYPELEVRVPQIYYGEAVDTPVYVNTQQEEFDFPRGDTNALVRYHGRGGVALENLWRKFVFGWKFDGTRFFLSSYPRAESRVLFHRAIRERVSILAPFLRFDADPYVALVDGRLVWIIDAYTVSARYPYSAPYVSHERIGLRGEGGRRELAARTATALDGVNYVRNSVKAVVDAYHGTVTLYRMDNEDPILAVWQEIFPRLFRPAAAMSEELRAHLRYPEDYLLAQGLVYARYHMLDADVFYNQEDLWVRSTEKYYGSLRPVEPYYVMWQPPATTSAEFTLMLPFSPKEKQVMIGWIAGLCDAENYGRFLAYKFPKERRVLGPQQVETKIDQHPFLSGQLTLWDQRGSTVIRGNVLAIPIGQTILYVEPIYLRAETAAYPELRLVAVMHDDRLSYGETFEQALAGLIGDPASTSLTTSLPTTYESLRRAGALLSRFQELQGEGRFEEAGAVLEELGETLRSALSATREGAAPGPAEDT